MWMKNVNNFQIAEAQPQGSAFHLLDFCQFPPGVPYNSVVYKKKACTSLKRLW